MSVSVHQATSDIVPITNVTETSVTTVLEESKGENKEKKNKQTPISTTVKQQSDDVKVLSKKNKKKVQEDEAFQRLNFLHQAAHTVMASCPNKPDIAAYYGNIMFSIGRKTLLRMEPAVKRTICKGCQSLLLPGISARVRVHKHPSPCVLWTCIRCQTRRRFLTKRGYQLWSEKPEAVVP